MTRPALFTIPPDRPFLDTLAHAWLAETGQDPARVADGLFLLPTRRAARSLSEAFLRLSRGKPLLLPRIAALGGLDEVPLALAGALDLPPAIDPQRRLAILTTLILRQGGQNGAPASADRAWLLAGELASLLDEAARAEVDLTATLPALAAGDFAEHWGVTLGFLQIVTRAWPDWLAEERKMDVAARPLALLKIQAQSWRKAPPSFPVIAAGTTGAIPAVARLLDVVAHLPQGRVVLPGLDLDLDEASWSALEETHPQASLRDLLARLGAERRDVAPFPVRPGAPASPAGPDRLHTLRLALLPAPSLDQWQTASPSPSGLQLLDAADGQEEASGIALLLRSALEEPGTRAALVTPDRALAQRVAAELLRFGIVADDSAGERLADTPPATFLRLLAQASCNGLRPVPLLSVLKHPLCGAGQSQAACRADARRLEKKALRGPAPPPGLQGLRQKEADPEFLDRLARCLEPLPDCTGPLLPASWLRCLLQAAENLASTDTEHGAARLWAQEEGEALAEHLTSLLDAFAALPPQDPRTLPGLLDSALAGAVVRSRRAVRGREGAEHPRIFIWGLLEARLQAADLMVLGGLAEGVWPPAAEPGPWLNRTMRAAAKLPSPEQSVGLAAHDFVSSCCAGKTVILSAPRRRAGAPAVPSRWLVRLQALLAGSDQRLPASPAAAWAAALGQPAASPRPVPPPAPRPDIRLRPRKLSVTEIETWMRDPYAIHARHILRLKKLPPIEESADAADYGNIVHEALANFFRSAGTAWPHDALRRLLEDMDTALNAAPVRPALAAWWRPRLRRIAAWVADAEPARRSATGTPAILACEIAGEWVFSAPAGEFTLKGKADRIERRSDGTLAILDYKTGQLPRSKDVESGHSPQLSLEAAMAGEGAWGDALRGEAIELTYWRLPGGAEAGEARTLFAGKPAQVAEMIVMAADQLRALVTDFDSPDRAYLSQPHPLAAPRFSDYAQLARVAEWIAPDES